MSPEGLTAPARTQVDISVLGLFERGGEWLPLPDWARYHLEAGLSIGRVQLKGQRCIHAIVVPTRDYAATLCASGAVLAAYEDESSASAEQQFNELCESPEGTAVTLRDGRDRRRRMNGYLTNVRTGYDGEPLLGIQIGRQDSGGTRYRIPLSEVWRVGLVDQTDDQLQKPQRARMLQAVNPFAEDVLYPLDARRFTEPGNLGCLIVGARARVAAEAEHQGFATKPEHARSRPAPGILDDLLRLQKNAGARNPHRSTVLPARASGIPESIAEQTPAVVVFDGANGYLKWRDRLRAAHAVVVLDRTDPRYGEAADQLQSDYVRRTDDSPLWTPPPPPPGVEAIRFGLASA